LDVVAAMLDWFDVHLRASAPAAFTPAVRYYVMGAVGEPGAPGNEWREAADWPVAAQQRAYYLKAGGGLSVVKPETDAPPTEFLSDPVHPAPMPGRLYPAARDGRVWERDPNVRTFTSELLPDPVEWTGKVEVELFASSSAPDVDFIVRVSDVYPDGRSIMLIDSIRRARYRDSFTEPSLLVPGRVYRIAFDVGWLSQIFNRGHRIRVSVSSTGSDFYEPNPNTGEAFGPTPAKRTVVAQNRLYHDADQACRIIAPLRSAHAGP
jgi:putative CocE/NonD family hydrolase